MLDGRTVMVTGATGFIGGRLVEKLILQHNARVRALVRNLGKAARIARLPVELRQGELDDAAAVTEAVAGCDIVVHCAHQFGSDQPNLVAAQTLADACLQHNARLVYVSSVSAYDPPGDGELTEASPYPACDSAYALCKRKVEAALLERAERDGLALSIVQPTIVYGPFCKPWTIEPTIRVRTSRVVLPREGEGLCNAVYVDDVVDALLLAGTRDEALGRRFLISGPEPITWRAFYGAFERAVGVESVVCMSDEEIDRASAPAVAPTPKRLWLDPQWIRAWPPARAVYEFLRCGPLERGWARVRDTLPKPYLFPEGELMSLYRAQCHVCIDNARNLLGYEPRFGFDGGMALTAAYLQWAYLKDKPMV